MRLASLLVCASLVGALSVNLGCATQQTDTSTAVPTASADGGLVTPLPSKKGIIAPGDPPAGTAGLGTQPGGLGSDTGTAGTRINPASPSGNGN